MDARFLAVSICCFVPLSLFCPPSFSAIIDFEEFPHEYELQGMETTVNSKGYSLSYTPASDEPYPTSLYIVGPSWRYNGRSSAMITNSCSATVKLTSYTNSPMTALSIDLDELNGDTSGSVTFIGITMDDTFIKKTVRLNGKPAWQRFYFPSIFRNLKSLSWDQGDCINNFPHMYDNIHVVPTKIR